MKIPSLIIIGSTTSDSQRLLIRQTLDITPPAGALITDYDFVQQAREYSTNIVLDNLTEEELIAKYLPVSADLQAPLVIFLPTTIPIKIIFPDNTQEIPVCS